MQEKDFYIVDVFAEEKYSGNQLAVVMASHGMDADEMQRIASEMDYSETTFILPGKAAEDGYNVRIFTPRKEVPFAGHPTLGTAYVILKEIIRERTDTVVLDLKAGRIPVRVTYENGEIDKLVMRQLDPGFGGNLRREDVAGALGIHADDLDGRFPVEEVSTGLSFILATVVSLEAMKRIQLDTRKYYQLIEHRQSKAILVFCPETYQDNNHLNVRMFAPYLGIEEDPATGSGCGCLAGYLVKHRYFGSGNLDVRAEQGYEIGRPSLLFLQAAEKNGSIEIHVGGRVIPVAKGELM